MKAPVVYIPHGGGPLPLLDDPAHAELSLFLRGLPSMLGTIKAILVISAHWEEPIATVMTGEAPGMLFDYFGFPAESYKYKYSAPGAPELAEQVARLIHETGLTVAMDSSRDFDHGLFVPLMLMYPRADIPTFQLSLSVNLDPAYHYRLGESLQALRHQGVLILGSGLSFHNLKPEPASHVAAASEAFDDWLTEICTATELTPSERRDALLRWEQAPHARFCHPREEHLLPLHVCAGAAGGAASKRIFNDTLWDWRVSSFLWR